jgi:hypothetical protein
MTTKAVILPFFTCMIKYDKTQTRILFGECHISKEIQQLPVFDLTMRSRIPFEAEMDTFTDGRATLKLVIVGKLDREQEASYRFQVLDRRIVIYVFQIDKYLDVNEVS